MIQYLEVLINSKKDIANYLERYLTQLSHKNFKLLVSKIQHFISAIFDPEDQQNDHLWEAIQVLDIFYKANQKRDEDEKLSFKEFYNETVNYNVNLNSEYDDWLQQKSQMLDPDESYVNISNFINFSWILDT